MRFYSADNGNRCSLTSHLNTRPEVAIRLRSRPSTAISLISYSKPKCFSDCHGASHLTAHAKPTIGPPLGTVNAAVVAGIRKQRSAAQSMYSRGIITGYGGRDMGCVGLSHFLCRFSGKWENQGTKPQNLGWAGGPDISWMALS